MRTTLGSLVSAVTIVAFATVATAAPISVPQIGSGSSHELVTFKKKVEMKAQKKPAKKKKGKTVKRKSCGTYNYWDKKTKKCKSKIY